MDSLRNALPTLPHRDLSICIAFLITLVAFIIFTLIYRCPIQINRSLANLPGRVRRIPKRSSTTSSERDQTGEGRILANLPVGVRRILRRGGNRSLDNLPVGVPKPSPISSATSTGGDEDEKGRILANLPDGVRRILKRGGKFKAGDVVRQKKPQRIYVVNEIVRGRIKLLDGKNKYDYLYSNFLKYFERVKTAKQSPVKIEKGNEYRLTDDIKSKSLEGVETFHEYKKGAIVTINEVRDDDFVTVNESDNLVPKKMLEEVPQ